MTMTSTHHLRRSLPSLLLVAACLASEAHSQQLVATLTGNPGDTSIGTLQAVSGDWAVIGVTDSSEDRLRFYEKTSAGWGLAQDWAPDLDQFTSLALDGDNLAVGGRKALDDTVLIYERQVDGTWALAASFVDPGVFDGVYIAKTAFFDKTLAVGYSGDDVGYVRVYRDFGSGWTQINEFVGGPDINLFGSYLDLEGPWLAIGRPDQEQGGGGGGWAGWIKIYRDQGTHYSFVKNILGGPGMGFSDLDLDVDRLLTLDDTDAKAYAKVYYYDGASWTLEAEWPVPLKPWPYGDVALRGKTAIIGSPEDDDVGAIYTFAREGTTWFPTGRLVDESGLSADDFGKRMDVSGATLIVAGMDADSLGAQVFDFPISTNPYGVCPDDLSPCGNGDPYAGCLNSTGQGATLRVQGTVSVAQDDLVFTMRSLPPNQFGLLFMGGAWTSVPFGDGQLVVGGGSSGLFRFLPQQADSTGTLVQGPGLVALAAQLGLPIGAGATWNLQGWYRDSQGSPCGGNFNLTNGVQVRFKP